ncbi:receptor-type guanylate cyclase gcy-22-like [Photinus pyralis]|uniref:Gamma-aminobutyric acid type B receptor subunit 2 n=2 Tax=Photinus pyralis TaxID=7054 RepID=A0A1Y1M6Q5_PHOPY|nr:receptor-type guanylate cyclase gcy-22-like [Photinus pyralis]
MLPRTKIRRLLGLLCMTFAALPFVETAYNKCLVNRTEVNPKRFLHYEGRFLNITLEMSNSISHKLSTHVFKIFLQEVLGYPNVEIYPEDDNLDVEEVMDRLSGPLVESNITVPRTMINVEVWVSPEFDTIPLLDTHHVRDCGTIAPPIRLGWFIPLTKDTMQLPPMEREVHWSSFKDSKYVQSFDILNEADRNLISSYSRDSSNYYCSDRVCDKGMYTPPQCTSPTKFSYVPCAILLAPYYNNTKFVIKQIDDLKLLVKVVWLGPNLKHVVTQLKNSRNSDQKLVILNWTPSEIILHDRDYIIVNFKRAELITSSLVGRYELIRMVKYSWSKLEKYAKVAYESLHRLKFSEQDYDLLLELYNERSKTSGIYDIACEWMLQRKPSWTQWIPVSDREKSYLYIGGIFPLTGSSYMGKGILQGALMAREAINQNSAILRDYTLQLLASDGQCKADKVMKAFIDYIVDNYYSNLVGVLGPACSDTVEPLAGVSKHYKTLVISYSAEGASFSDRQKYPYFFRTIGENKQYKHVYLKMFQAFEWKRVASLTEDGQKYTEYITHMENLLEMEGISFISNTKFPRERDVVVMTRYLEDLKRKRAKIIIADVFDDVARSVMCEAYKLEMTARQGYVWFLPLWLNISWYDTDYFNTLSNEKVNCTTENMIEAINGYFSLTSAYFAPDDQIMQENKTVGQWKTEYKARAQDFASDFAGFAYDAVWTYALALDQLVKEDPEAITALHSLSTTNKLVNLVKQTDFYGVSGRIKFRGGPSRFSIINVMQFMNNSTYIVGSFHPNISDDLGETIGGELMLNKSRIRWLTPDGKVPDDGTLPASTCTLNSLAEFLNVECEMAIIILNLIVAFILLAVVVLTVYIIKRQYDKKMQLTERYMKSLGIDLLNPSNIGGLDKWEIPRESVVINRKLGEGAFGTVYGGEANFPESGWLAVAVKTLKLGSTTEEKLDFLSEAEVMKRFDHKNIVRLLGVCTKKEPVYTIMEFMLYGDLKTFLLARRHLVYDKLAEESEEVSSKKLTSMALDVARGLSYLAELKYVHRDVASRNCLVNSQRVVKLGDFGMTRPMFENDYYKFNRKGMLPVRWMAPESLTLGVFTPASDVWSYGVLLYEIITFGSFPFQGLSNNQVLEHVKAGNILSVPSGIKTQLEGLLKSCWNQDSKIRPTSSEIVEFLANNPRLLTPCLDVPISSVQMEDTGQLEMHLPEKFRKCSVSLGAKTPLPNGISSSSFDSKLSSLRQNSVLENNGSIQPDKCCPREPLLGPPSRSESFIGLNKYISVQNNRENYCQQSTPNGHAITKL